MLTHAQMMLIRLAAGAIAGVAAWVSYWHMVTVCRMAGEHGASAYLMPALPDASMLIASMLLAAKGVPEHTRKWARIMLASGLVASLGANVMTADLGSPLSIVVAAWPAITLFCVSETLLRTRLRVKRTRTAAAVVEQLAEVAPVVAPVVAPAPVPRVRRQRRPLVATGQLALGV